MASKQIGCCPSCGKWSGSVKAYKKRKLQHYSIGGMDIKEYPVIVLRCGTESCPKKTFTYQVPVIGLEELEGRSRYTKSSKQFVVRKLLNEQISYNGFCKSIKADFGGQTSLSSLHRWAKETVLEEVKLPLGEIKVLHTDEKHPSKKKRTSDKKYVIASAGRTDAAANSVAVHANLADSNSIEAITAHYQELIDKGLDSEKVELVVTDMLAAYVSVIKTMFPNALHQICIFHLIQHLNKLFKAALKIHRYEHFKEGDRKEAHLIALLMLKGQEKLTEEEQQKVQSFCDTYPDVAADYALKEDMRFLYAAAQNLEQAVAYKDIIVETYTPKISKEMEKAMLFFEQNFEQSIAYIKLSYIRDKTNNDAERMMRHIKRTQQTHYFLRDPKNYIRKVNVILGIRRPIAA